MALPANNPNRPKFYTDAPAPKAGGPVNPNRPKFNIPEQEPYVYQEYPKAIKSKHTGRSVNVNSPEEEAHHTGMSVQAVMEQPKPGAPVHVKPVFHAYPKWVTSKQLGKKVIVHSAEEEEQHTGIAVNEDGTEAVEPAKPQPPTLEVVMAAEYDEKNAKLIVAEEQRKFEAREQPYGPNAVTRPNERKAEAPASTGEYFYKPETVASVEDEGWGDEKK